MRKKIIIALGSNYEPELHIEKAKEKLFRLFPDMVFSHNLWTQPIGVVSGRFVNALALAYTSFSKEHLEQLLKQVERECGRCAEEKKEGKIRMDLDLMLYGSEKLHLKDWNREYIFTLLKDLDEDLSEI